MRAVRTGRPWHERTCQAVITGHESVSTLFFNSAFTALRALRRFFNEEENC